MDALTELTAQEMAAAISTVKTLQSDPVNPGLSLHRVDRAKDKGFWTARVNDDLRIVLHKKGEDTLIAYVAHHDDAYHWAERRRLDIHPSTGAAQLVEVRERVEEIVIPVYVAEEVAKPKLFEATPETDLLACGVPPDWIGDVRAVDEDSLFALSGHLPAEAMEALLDLAVGIAPAIAKPTSDPYEHPDAKRRFHLLTDEQDLARALEAPWDKWAVFLHPAQREFVDRDFAGPARVIGSAGTGKTVVALHRAARLAREHPGARVLLTTFNEGLAANLARKFAVLTAGEIDLADRVTITALPSAMTDLHDVLIGPTEIASDEAVREALREASARSDLDVSDHFLKEEWDLIVDGRQVPDREAYCDLPRFGRRRRLAGAKREALWTIFNDARSSLADHGLTTYPTMLGSLSRRLQSAENGPFDFIVVDEAQDVSAAELRVLGMMAGHRPNGLFFAGDIGQRIFRSPFPWKAEGVDIQGRSRSLKVNYRTSFEIKRQTERLLPSTILEADGSEDNRLGVQSLFGGPAPRIVAFNNKTQEAEAVGEWLSDRLADGLPPPTIALLVRSEDEIEHARLALQIAGLGCGDKRAGDDDKVGVTVALMHDAKGQEFRAVAVMACDESVIPNEKRMAEVSDANALGEVYATERHLLYVACTRAREFLLVTGVAPISEFLQDLRSV